MQHSKFTLADKMQYVTKLLGYHQVALHDLFERVHAKMGHEDGWDVQADFQWLDQCFQICYGDFTEIDKTIYGVLEATDSKQAIAAVKQLSDGFYAVRSLN